MPKSDPSACRTMKAGTSASHFGIKNILIKLKKILDYIISLWYNIYRKI